MLQEKAGLNAGRIWEALNEKGSLATKDLKKATKFTDKDLYLGLGWLLREDKIAAEQVDEKEHKISLK